MTNTTRESVRCTHCGEPGPGAERDEQGKWFCCVGCASVHHALLDAGFDAFYALSDGVIGARAQRAAAPTSGEESMLSGAHLFDAASEVEEGVFEIWLDIEGVHCAGCLWLIEQMPRALDGVLDASLDLGRGRLVVRWREDLLEDPHQIVRWLSRFGYAVSVLDREKLEVSDSGERSMLRRVGVAWAIAGNVMLLSAAHYVGMTPENAPFMSRAARWVMLAMTTASLLYCARPIFERAVGTLRAFAAAGAPVSVDVPLAIGVMIGFGASAHATWTGAGSIWLDSVAMLIAAILTARYVQVRESRRAQQRAQQLLAVIPRRARRVNDFGVVEEVDVCELVEGDLVEVRAGEVCPGDGVIVSGAAALHRGALTGESRLIPASSGDAVEAGVISHGGAIVVRVERVGDGSRLGKLLGWIEERGAQRTELSQTIDRLAGWFVMVVLLVALLVGAAWWFVDPSMALEVMVAILVISCPCALGMATPLALALATSRAASSGIFIKNDDTIEACAKADVVVFDKTGTLTMGTPSILDFAGAREHLSLAAALESRSAHPLAVAIRDTFTFDPMLEIEVIEDRFGAGLRGLVDGHDVIVGRTSWVREVLGDVTPDREVSAMMSSLRDRGASVVAVAIDGELCACVGLADEVRGVASETIASLQSRGVRVMLLSGDHDIAARTVAHSVGILDEDVIANASPEQKLAVIEDLIAAGYHVVMVGDGVNDAAALRAAHVGVAVEGGAHVSLAAADVFLTRSGLQGVLELFEGASRVSRAIRRSIAYALAYNLFGISLAATGHVSPLIAALLMPISSLLLLAMTIAARSFLPAESNVKNLSEVII